MWGVDFVTNILVVTLKSVEHDKASSPDFLMGMPPSSSERRCDLKAVLLGTLQHVFMLVRWGITVFMML